MYMPHEPPTVAPDADRPSLERLSVVLRNRELWPRGFQWWYGMPDTCAIGLACRLWPESFGGARYVWADALSRVFDMRRPDVQAIFFDAARGGFFADYCAVTPATVADAIDAYLARRAHAA